jgi:hypothetical protein
MKRLPLSATPQERFWAKVNITLTCWEWTGARKHNGYGVFTLRTGLTVRAHRLSYEWAHGLIPDRMQVDHMCGNRLCVRVDHLRLVTNKQNQEHRSGATARSITGVRGVYPHTSGYQAMVTSNGVKSTRWFRTVAEAEAWAIAKRAELFTHDDGVQAW